jgi:hypothetical protein
MNAARNIPPKRPVAPLYQAMAPVTFTGAIAKSKGQKPQ